MYNEISFNQVQNLYQNIPQLLCIRRYKKAQVKIFLATQQAANKWLRSKLSLTFSRAFILLRGIMNEGIFCFISDDYLKKFSNHNLMENKETINGETHNRPCYYTFKDGESPIYWVVPISSQFDKYKEIYDEKCKKYNDYDGIVFGYVLGRKAAFLIQNMCPITDEYIIEEYIDSTTNTCVSIPTKLKKEINAKARKAVRLYRRGIKIVFANILEIESVLIAELSQIEAQQEVAPATAPVQLNDINSFE